MQMLEASRMLHKFFHDCRDCLSRILEKNHAIPEDLGRDSSSVGALRRKHQNFLKVWSFVTVRVIYRVRYVFF